MTAPRLSGWFVSILLGLSLLGATTVQADEKVLVLKGQASWYGEAHRGKLMANGRRFDPDKLTAASWFYPLGTKVRVTITHPALPRRTLMVTVTDRGPAYDLVREGRIIDLARGAFRRLAPTDVGLVGVVV